MIDVELVLPAGWAVLPTAPDTERVRKWAIDRIIGRALPPTLPRDRAEPWRRELRKQLTASTDEASRQGARWVVLPLREFNSTRIPGSMLITILEDQDPQDPEQLLASILDDAGPDGSCVDIGGATAARISAVIHQEMYGRDTVGVRVSYYLPHPDRPGVWGLMTFSVLAGADVDDPVVRAIVFLFDTIAATLRWVDRDAAPTQDEVLAMVTATVAELEEVAS
ncbi:hypothetical protein [Catenulispora pinisilvae]|uniref:hypothetical protein n=1 Tax=Catenulispora pinisilvae TaxID=2705253 RepID=UPI001891C4CB|nr:hypothetical protein [Catenulispora pinisilvae]